MLAYSRHLPVLIILLIVLGLNAQIWLRVRRGTGWALIAAAVLLGTGFSLGLTRVVLALPAGPWMAWVRALALGWALLSFGLFVAFWLWRRAPAFDPKRRGLLQAASGVALAAPVLAMGFGAFVERVDLEAREVDLPMDNLPPALDGLRLAQLTDLHMGPFMSERDVARAVAMANEFRPHLAFVTGDLITDGGDPLDACIERLAELRASDGIYGCMGNHEGYVRVEAYTAREGMRRGIDFLRGESRLLRFGDASVNLVGVDHQTMGRPYLVEGPSLSRPGYFNILLSHNPDVFPVAAMQGYDLTIAGHTHGGQLIVEARGLTLTPGRFFTSYIRGLYRQGLSALYVSRGIGTVGIPVRLGAPPEVTLIRLRAGKNSASD